MSAYRIRFFAPESAVDAMQLALEEVSEAQSAFEVTPGEPWRIEGYCEEKPDMTVFRARLALACASLGLPEPDAELEDLGEIDWLAENRKDFPPIQAGRVYIYGSHVTDAPPAASVPLLIDAGIAFGSGEHATTQGCLLALQKEIRRRGNRWRKARFLDMGCGTGVLGLALASMTRRPVIASDLDRDAARVTGVNARDNGLASLVTALEAPGYRHSLIARKAPYDLIVANILARPLCRMAPDLARSLKPGGIAVLSGLLNWQERQVLAAHRAQGLHLLYRQPVGNWHTLVLQKGNRAG